MKNAPRPSVCQLISRFFALLSSLCLFIQERIEMAICYLLFLPCHLPPATCFTLANPPDQHSNMHGPPVRAHLGWVVLGCCLCVFWLSVWVCG
ncbi:hypothetical protein BKA81DRAFT_354035 [Phyllosticta paracitricarpa]|uniref:Uncharacterized protein n=1 Tax=Phyllosticta paracitricarpa TaxID=2016321 RepID=A0ABR1N0I9_9PEZI